MTCLRFTGIRNLQTLDKRSEENRQYLNSVKERAEMLGTRERQLEDYKRRLSSLNLKEE